MKGLRLPVGVDATGRTAVSNGDEQASKVIMLALTPCDSDNAFQQDIGLPDATFSVSTGGMRARVEERLLTIFEEFEQLQLYKLLKSTLSWTHDGEEAVLDFSYLNLETDEVTEFSHTYGGGR